MRVRILASTILAVLFLCMTQQQFVLGQSRLSAENETHRVEFDASGMRFHMKTDADFNSNGRFEFRFKSASIGNLVLAEAVDGAEPTQQGDGVFYARAGILNEKYRAIPGGVEQLFVLTDELAGASGDLEIRGEVMTPSVWEQSPVSALGALTFYSKRGPALIYGPVVATDADGGQAEVEIRLEGTRMTLVLDSALLKGVRYPLMIRSSIQTQAVPRDASPEAAGEPVNVAVKRLTAQEKAMIELEDMPVWRAQIRISTVSGTGAGTNDRVMVRLNSENSTWLYSSYRDDFEAGQSYTYDLTLGNVKTLRDIANLELSKIGSDDWCIKSFTLYINGSAIYSADFAGRWFLGNSASHKVWSTDLRNNTLWQSYVRPAAPLLISGAELMHRIEAMTGDFLTESNSSLRFSPSVDPARHAVQVSTAGTRTVRVDMDLKYRKVYTSIFPWENKVVTYEVDVEFDLEFQCISGLIFVQTRNLDMAYPVVDNASLVEKTMLQTLIQPSLAINMQVDLQKNTYTKNNGEPACPPIQVIGGSVYLY